MSDIGYQMQFILKYKLKEYKIYIIENLKFQIDLPLLEELDWPIRSLHFAIEISNVLID